MEQFKFLTSQTYPTQQMIDLAYNIGRESYILGRDITYNPFISAQTNEAFELGWMSESIFNSLNERVQVSE